MNLKEHNIIVYDLEIEKEVSEVEGGWDNPEAMGISVACAYHYGQGAYRFYDRESEKHNVTVLAERLSKADLVVGFNHINFDSRVMAGAGAPYEPRQEMDLLRLILESWWQLEVPPKGEEWPSNYPPRNEYFGGWGLSDICQATLSMGKTGDGAAAPKKWKKGMIADVYNYCRDDVMLTRRLFEYILEHRSVENLKGNRAKLDLEPWESELEWMARREITAEELMDARRKDHMLDGLQKAIDRGDVKIPGRPTPEILGRPKATHWHRHMKVKVAIIEERGGAVLVRKAERDGRLGAKVECKYADLIPIDTPLGPMKHIKKMEPHPLILQDDAAQGLDEE